MAKITVKITWNEARQQWDMTHARDKFFIQEFSLFPCENFYRLFPGAKKDKANYYQIKINKCKYSIRALK